MDEPVEPGPMTASHALAWLVGAWSRRALARALVRATLDLHVVGLEHVPARGSVILVARHYHHLYDAAAILASLQRDVHIMIALDWLGGGVGLRLMRWLAATARWPGVWRQAQAGARNRGGYRLSLDLLREGRVLLIFPEGYPTVDPEGSRKGHPEAFLPFEAGCLVLAERAGSNVPIVPVGLWYAPHPRGGWTVWLRCGPPLARAAAGNRAARLAWLEAEVRRLSAPPAI